MIKPPIRFILPLLVVAAAPSPPANVASNSTCTDQKLPTKPNAEGNNASGSDQAECKAPGMIVFRSYEQGGGAHDASANEKKKDGKSDADGSSSDIPWLIAALIAFAGGGNALLTALSGLFTVRSTHGAARGFVRLDDVRIQNHGGADVLTFRVVNVGGKDLRGIRFAGWVQPDGRRNRYRLTGPFSVQQLKPGGSVAIRCASDGGMKLFNAILWCFFRRGDAGMMTIYADHADVVYKEFRTYDRHGTVLRQRRWRTRRAFYSIG